MGRLGTPHTAGIGPEALSNLRVISDLLEKSGNPRDAERMKEHAFAIATEADINTHGYQLMGAGKVTEAIAVFQKNVKEHPDSWNVYDSLAEAYER